jgi:hypothetical protein
VVRHPSTSLLYLFEGGKLCTFLASQTLATLSVSTEGEGFLIRGSLEEVLALANQRVASKLHGK